MNMNWQAQHIPVQVAEANPALVVAEAADDFTPLTTHWKILSFNEKQREAFSYFSMDNN